MLCIDNRCTDIYFNLAAEEYLLKQKQMDFFMIWQSRPAVVIGRHQQVAAETDSVYLKEMHIDLARRFSGGGAVYHDLGNVNLTFIATDTQPDFQRYLLQVIDFLDTLGITVLGDSRLGISLNGEKISGSAQCMHKNRMLYHCTLLFSSNLSILNTVLHTASPSPLSHAVASVRSSVTNIRDHLPHPFEANRFIRLALRYFLDKHESNCLYRFSAADLAAIEQLKSERYVSEEWIYAR